MLATIRIVYCAIPFVFRWTSSSKSTTWPEQNRQTLLPSIWRSRLRLNQHCVVTCSCHCSLDFLTQRLHLFIGMTTYLKYTDIVWIELSVLARLRFFEIKRMIVDDATSSSFIFYGNSLDESTDWRLRDDSVSLSCWWLEWLTETNLPIDGMERREVSRPTHYEISSNEPLCLNLQSHANRSML